MKGRGVPPKGGGRGGGFGEGWSPEAGNHATLDLVIQLVQNGGIVLGFLLHSKARRDPTLEASLLALWSHVIHHGF